MRIGRRWIPGTVAVVAAVTLGAGTAYAVPAPAEPVTPAAPGIVSEVFGANAAGDVFYSSLPAIGEPNASHIRHADGTIADIGVALTGDGAIASDGSLWISMNGSLWKVTPDGVRTEYPIVGTGTTATAGIGEVEAGADGRIWFVDRDRSQVGSVAVDGSDPQVHDVVGSGRLWQLAPGVDGRMWMVREGGAVQAVTADGTVSSYGTLGRTATGLRASGGALYAVAGSDLIRIGTDGVRTTVRSSAAGFIDVGTSGGWAWFAEQTRVLAVSPSGRIASFAIDDSYALPNSFGGDLSLTPDPAGGFVGAYGAGLVRIPSAAVNETFTVSGQVISVRGANVLRVTAAGTTPGGSPLTGPLDVVLWGGAAIPENFLVVVHRGTVAGRVQLVRGRATIDIPVTTDLVRRARPSGLLHTSCCSISVRRPGTPGSPGLTSWPGRISGGPPGSYYGPLVPSSTMIWLDSMYRGAVGRGMDANGQVYWAGELSAGRASRTTVAKTVVGSSAYRAHRVDDAYARWFGRQPTDSERTYWANRLVTGTTSSMDLALAAKPAARDAGGTTNAQRGAHLAAALHLKSSYGTSYRSKLDAGTSWSTVVRDAYWSSAAKETRINEMGTRSSYTPSVSSLASGWAKSGDERAALIAVLATLPYADTLYV